MEHNSNIIRCSLSGNIAPGWLNLLCINHTCCQVKRKGEVASHFQEGGCKGFPHCFCEIYVSCSDHSMLFQKSSLKFVTTLATQLSRRPLPTSTASAQLPPTSQVGSIQIFLKKVVWLYVCVSHKGRCPRDSVDLKKGASETVLKYVGG